MKLVFLGTGSARPTPRRGLSCACLDLRGEILVFDAGEGTQAAYVRSGLKWNKKMRIFVTHMHGDHCIGLLGLLQTMSLQGRSEPVEVYGPAGIEEFVAQNARMLGFGPAYPVIITEVSAGTVAKGDGYRVRACRASHSVLALSYLFVEDDLPGRFYPSKARELGIPRGQLWHKLQHGSSVRAGGRTVTPSQVTGKARPGKRIGISGDTRPTKALERFFAGCDYLVFDSTFQDEHAERAAKTGHSTAREAASLAKRAGARNLILTHFSSRYPDERGLLKEASSVHKSVTAAKDMLRIRML